MIKTIEVGFPGGKGVDAIIDDRLIKTDQRSEKVGEGFPTEHEAAINRAMDLCAVKKHLMNAPEFEILTS